MRFGNCLYISHTRYNWQLGSTNNVEKGSNKVLNWTLFQPDAGWHKDLNQSWDVICRAAMFRPPMPLFYGTSKQLKFSFVSYLFDCRVKQCNCTRNVDTRKQLMWISWTIDKLRLEGGDSKMELQTNRI